jgi:hypothetical protein
MRDLETKLAQIEAQQRATQAEFDTVHQTFRQLAPFPEANRGSVFVFTAGCSKCVLLWKQRVGERTLKIFSRVRHARENTQRLFSRLQF